MNNMLFDDAVTPSKEAVKAIKRVRDSFTEDYDKLLRELQAGGGLLEMRSTVEAAYLIKEIRDGLDKAANMLLER